MTRNPFERLAGGAELPRGQLHRDAVQRPRLGSPGEEIGLVVAISVDPRGDTRTAVKRWLTLHQEPTNFHYLIGSQHALAPIWKAFFVSPQIPGDPQSSHAAIIWLVNRHDHLAALIPAGLPINTTNLAHDFATLQSQ
jgi:cytochrome oxidase Cu insertion factor (SCO1/SenC/PrrC family)